LYFPIEKSAKRLTKTATIESIKTDTPFLALFSDGDESTNRKVIFGGLLQFQTENKLGTQARALASLMQKALTYEANLVVNIAFPFHVVTVDFYNLSEGVLDVYFHNSDTSKEIVDKTTERLNKLFDAINPHPTIKVQKAVIPNFRDEYGEGICGNISDIIAASRIFDPSHSERLEKECQGRVSCFKEITSRLYPKIDDVLQRRLEIMKQQHREELPSSKTTIQQRESLKISKDIDREL
jgi:hypothetical protein